MPRVQKERKEGKHWGKARKEGKAEEKEKCKTERQKGWEKLRIRR